MKKFAFTLAEVLIVLVIIGVVASITIPSLMNKTQDQELKTAWKKEYSAIGQATLSIANDNGGTIKGLCAEDDSDCLSAYYAKELRAIDSRKDADPDVGNVWHEDNKWRYLNNSPVALGDYEAGFVLADGALVMIWEVHPDCTADDEQIHSCANILVDVNGHKLPNTIGKDIFSIHVLENSVKPYGVQGDDDIYNPNVSCIPGSFVAENTGIGCSAKYLME